MSVRLSEYNKGENYIVVKFEGLQYTPDDSRYYFNIKCIDDGWRIIEDNNFDYDDSEVEFYRSDSIAVKIRGLKPGKTYTIYGKVNFNGTWYDVSNSLTVKTKGSSGSNTGGNTGGGNSGGEYDSRIGELSNFRVKDESATEISFRCNPSGKFDYLKVYLNGSYYKKLYRGKSYIGDGKEYTLDNDGYFYEYSITNLSPNTTYEIKVVGYRNNGDYGRTYKASTSTEFTPPSNVKATVNGRVVTINYDRGENNDKVEILNYNGGKIADASKRGPVTIDLGKHGYLWGKKYTLKLRGVSGSHKTSEVTTNRFETEPNPNPVVIKGIKRGDRGPQVIGIQQLLCYLGYLKSKADIDGEFGQTTEDAVKAYQRNMGMTETGVVDDNTRGRLADSARSNYTTNMGSAPVHPRTGTYIKAPVEPDTEAITTAKGRIEAIMQKVHRNPLTNDYYTIAKYTYARLLEESFKNATHSKESFDWGVEFVQWAMSGKAASQIQKSGYKIVDIVKWIFAFGGDYVGQEAATISNAKVLNPYVDYEKTAKIKMDKIKDSQYAYVIYSSIAREKFIEELDREIKSIDTGSTHNQNVINYLKAINNLNINFEESKRTIEFIIRSIDDISFI